MHVRNIRKLREDGSAPGDAAGPSTPPRGRSSPVTRADGSPRKRRPSTLSISMDESVASVMSPASPLPALTLDVEEYLNLLAGKHDTTSSAKLTAHLSAQELQEQLAMGEQELEDTKKRGACITKSVAMLQKLEAAVAAALEEDAFAERLIRHQQELVQRARAERGDQSLREKNLTKDVEKLERNYQRVAKGLAGVQTRRNADHDSFMAAFKKQASLMRELESTVAKRLGGLAERAANLRRSVQLLQTKHRNRGRGGGPGASSKRGPSRARRESPDTHGSREDDEDDARAARRGRRSRTSAASGSTRRIIRAPSSRSTRRPLSGRPSGEASMTAQLLSAEKEKAAAQRTNNRLAAKNKELQRALMEKSAALVEKENLVLALRRQQKQQVMALQKKVVTISKQLHQIHVDDLEA